jgi:hypothetical protein
MNLKKYRISAGHYRVGKFVIYGGSRIRWQVRDELDDIVDDFATLRQALRYAHSLNAPRLAEKVTPTQLPIDPTELRTMLAGPQN